MGVICNQYVALVKILTSLLGIACSYRASFSWALETRTYICIAFSKRFGSLQFHPQNRFGPLHCHLHCRFSLLQRHSRPVWFIRSGEAHMGFFERLYSCHLGSDGIDVNVTDLLLIVADSLSHRLSRRLRADHFLIACNYIQCSLPSL